MFPLIISALFIVEQKWVYSIKNNPQLKSTSYAGYRFATSNQKAEVYNDSLER